MRATCTRCGQTFDAKALMERRAKLREMFRERGRPVPERLYGMPEHPLCPRCPLERLAASLPLPARGARRRPWWPWALASWLLVAWAASGCPGVNL